MSPERDESGVGTVYEMRIECENCRNEWSVKIEEGHWVFRNIVVSGTPDDPELVHLLECPECETSFVQPKRRRLVSTKELISLSKEAVREKVEAS